MTQAELIEAAKAKLLTTTITGKQYALRGQPATGAWGDAWKLLEQAKAPPAVTGVNVSTFGVKEGVDTTLALQKAFDSGQDLYADAGRTFLVNADLALKGTVDFRGSVVKGGGIRAVSPAANLFNVLVTNANIGVKVEGGAALAGSGIGAEFCTYGMYVSPNALPCSLAGHASRNTIGLEIHSGNGGTVPLFLAEANSKFGVLLYDTVGWHFGDLTANDQGNAAANQAGTGVELWQNCHGNTFDKITALKNPGYALALNHASNGNIFGEIYADSSGAMDSDPGVSFTDGSSGNSITTLTVKHHSVGLRLGENDSGTDKPVNDNKIGTFNGSGLAYGAIRFEHGDRNEVAAAILADIGAVWPPWVRAAIEFAPLAFPVNNCKVGSVQRSGGWPQYGLHFGAAASGNSAPVSAGAVLDESGNKNTLT